MGRFLKILVIFLAVLAGQSFAADATGKLRVVVQVSDDDTARWNLALNNVKNVQKDVGAANSEVELVVYGPGIGMLKDDSVVASRIVEAVSAGIRVIACRNTMQAMHLKDDDMVAGVGFVQAGVVEIIRKQQEGWAYLRP